MNNRSSLSHASVFSKITVIVLICFMITSIFPVLGYQQDAAEKIKITETITFSEPVFEQNDQGYLDIYVEGASETTLTQGVPMLPQSIIVKKIPIGAKDIHVEFTHSALQDIIFDGTLAPGPIPQVLGEEQNSVVYTLLSKLSSVVSRVNQPSVTSACSVAALDDKIYSSDSAYGDLFTYSIYVGIDTDGVRKHYVVCTIKPFTITSMSEKQAQYFLEGDLVISYSDESTTSLADETYDLLILSPKAYIEDLQPLVTHKEDMGLKTKLVVLDDIYNEVYFKKSEEFSRDIQEEIKYFLYQAVPEWDVQYVMAVGGWRTFLGLNIPSKQFPVRYSHNVDGEPGYITEQYYSSFMAYDEEQDQPVFDSWDSNGNGIFAEWNFEGWDRYDPIPDVNFGRLACRNKIEVRNVVNKIITYETETYGEAWFNKILSVTGDGFQDMGYKTDVSVPWNVTGLPNGKYTIYAQSSLKDDRSYVGPIDDIEVWIDHSAPSQITFLEDDHLKIESVSDDQKSLYPAKPVAEIVVPSDNDILGNSDVKYLPPEAYIGERWAGVDYNSTKETLQIRSKSYDPRPHKFTGGYSPFAGEKPDNTPWLFDVVEDKGSHTCLKIWINNSDGETILGPVTRYSKMYYEGEIEAQQTLYYVGDEFEQTKIWTSNGNFSKMSDVIDAFNEGYGLAYINGHSSCMAYSDHLPGAPGGRDDGSVTGLATINTRFGLKRYAAEEGEYLFPLDHLRNGDKLPVLLYSGCHSGQFDTSFASLFYDPYNVMFGDRYGTWAPEGLAWWITKLPQGGSIATIGNAGLGSGYIGAGILLGLTGWLFPTFFYNYQHENIDILGSCYTKTLTDFSVKFDPVNDQTVRKHFEQWDLLGDPSLKIGGYPPKQETSDLGKTGEYPLIEKVTTSMDSPFLLVEKELDALSLDGTFQVTFNPENDTNPTNMLSTKDGEFVVGYTYETPNSGDIHPAFAYSNGGAVWKQMIWANPENVGHTSLYSFTDAKGKVHYVGSVMFDGDTLGAFSIPDITAPETWEPLGSRWLIRGGENGLAITGYTDVGETIDYAGLWADPGEAFACFGNYVNEIDIIGEDVLRYGRHYISDDVHHLDGDTDNSTQYHFFVCEKQSGSGGYILNGIPKPYSSSGHTEWRETAITGEFGYPQVASNDGVTIVVCEENNGIRCRRSTNNGITWQTSSVTNDGSKPKVIFKDNRVIECYFLRDNSIYVATSTDNGSYFTSATLHSSFEIDTSQYSPFVIDPSALLFSKEDGDIYADIYVDTVGAIIGDIELKNQKHIISSITNSGTINLSYLTSEIVISGDSPLAQFFGLKETFLERFFRGRVLRGQLTSEEVVILHPGDLIEITSSPLFGLGHVMITIRVLDAEGEVLCEKTEDAFLLGGRINLLYPEE